MGGGKFKTVIFSFYHNIRIALGFAARPASAIEYSFAKTVTELRAASMSIAGQSLLAHGMLAGAGAGFWRSRSPPYDVGSGGSWNSIVHGCAPLPVER